MSTLQNMPPLLGCIRGSRPSAFRGEEHGERRMPMMDQNAMNARLMPHGRGWRSSSRPGVRRQMRALTLNRLTASRRKNRLKFVA